MDDQRMWRMPHPFFVPIRSVGQALYAIYDDARGIYFLLVGAGKGGQCIRRIYGYCHEAYG